MEFKDRDLEAFWEDTDANPPRKIPSQLRRIVYRKLQMIDAASDLRDPRIPPSNRLEKLQHDRAGQHSIRVNDQPSTRRACHRFSRLHSLPLYTAGCLTD